MKISIGKPLIGLLLVAMVATPGRGRSLRGTPLVCSR